MKRKLLSFILAAAIVLTCFSISAFASETPKYSISDKTVTVGEEFEISVMINNNPGIISNRLKVVYDSECVSLISVENTGLLNGFTQPSPTVSSPYTLRWADSLASNNNISNGTIAVLRFKAVKETEETIVGIEHSEARNVNGQKITFSNASSRLVIYSENSPEYSVENKSVNKGDTFTLNISLNNNPGITSDRFKVYYDIEYLELKSFKNRNLLNGFTTPSPTISSPYTFRWADSLATVDNTNNGVLIELTFVALKETNETIVSVEHIESRNSSGAKFNFDNASGKITISDKIPSDPAALLAAINEARSYTDSDYTKESIEALYALADEYTVLANSEASQNEYDSATAEIINAIRNLDSLTNYSISLFNGTCVILSDGEKTTSIVFAEHINERCVALDVVEDGIVNAKDYAYLLRNHYIES